MISQGFKVLYIGLMENNNIIGASMLLIERKKNFKYAYAPRGFLIDYNDIWTKIQTEI